MYSKKPSFWEREVFFKDQDIIIVGSGLVGLLSALELRNKFPRRKILILERGALPSGASTKNAGFACFGSLSELIADLAFDSFESVVNLACSRYRGLQRLLSIIEREEIEYKEEGGMEIFQNDQQDSYNECCKYLDRFNEAFQDKLGLPNVYKKADDLLTKNGLDNGAHLILNQYEGQLNTGLLMQSLLEKANNADITIFNGLEVAQIDTEDKQAKAILQNGWEITAKKLIVANNAFAKSLIPSLDIQAVRNPVLITKPIDCLKLNGTFHLNEGYIYFRDVNSRVLIGGARNLAKEAETTSDFGINPLLEAHLLSILNDLILPGISFEIDTKWSGILGVGTNKKPIIKALNEHLFVAVKMGGMGLAISSLVATEVCDMIK